jgi:hypothetical protein
MGRLLLIDNRVEQYEQLAAAAAVEVLSFDWATESLEGLLTKITALPNMLESIGIIQHGSPLLTEYSVVASHPAARIDDSSMGSWAPLIAFFTSLKEAKGVQVVDFISCGLYASPNFPEILQRLEAGTGINYRASLDETGNPTVGGNWVQESDGVDIKSLYFTDAIDVYNVLLKTLLVYSNGYNKRWGMVNASSKVLNYSTNTFEKPGRLIQWGTTAGTPPPSDGGYFCIAGGFNVAAAIKSNGSIVTWGNTSSPAYIGPIDDNYKTIVATINGFAALKNDGSIVSWGEYSTGAPISTGYLAIATTGAGYAALHTNGTIASWGYSTTGAPTDSGYTAIATTLYAFAALKYDGSIKSWGSSSYGGTGAPTDSGYIAISSSQDGFAALKSDGTIKSWGGTSSSNAPIDNGYNSIAASSFGFAALKFDGSITSWGNYITGSPTGTGYTNIASTSRAFAALKQHGSIVSWGDINYGGANAPTDTGYNFISSTSSAFAALKGDGSIISWGKNSAYDISEISGTPTDTGYYTISSNSTSFAALKSSGDISSWGLVGAGFPTNVPCIGLYGVYNRFVAVVAMSDVELSTITVDGTTVANNGTISVANGTTSVAVVATPRSSYSSVTVSGNTGLVTGKNTIYMNVTAQDGTMAEYQINIYVTPLSANKELLTITAGNYILQPGEILQVPVGTASIDVSAVPIDTAASILSITGNTNLQAKGNNIVTITVQAADGSTGTHTFTVQVNALPQIGNVVPNTVITPTLPGTTNAAGTYITSVATSVATVSDAVYVYGIHKNSVDTIIGTDTTGAPVLLNGTPSGNYFLIKYDLNNNILWKKEFPYSSSSQAPPINPNRLAVTEDSVYIVGTYTSYTDTTIGTTSAGVPVILTASDPNKGPSFIIKYAANGDIQWAKQIQGVYYAYASSVAVSGNDIYVCGYYECATADTHVLEFGQDINGAVVSLPPHASTTRRAGFLTKYNAGGIVQWAITLSTNVSYIAADCVTANSSNVYVCGRYESTTQAMLAGSSISIPISTLRDGYLVAYDTTGTPQWLKTIAGTSNDSPTCVALTATNLYMACNYSSSSPLDIGNGLYLPSTSGTDGALLKYGFDGVTSWGKNIKGTGTDMTFSLATTAYDIYLCGYYTSNSIFQIGVDMRNTPIRLPPNSTQNAFLINYFQTGQTKWVKQIDCNSQFYGVAARGNDVYGVGRYFSPNASVAIGNNRSIAPSAGTTYNILIARYSSFAPVPTFAADATQITAVWPDVISTNSLAAGSTYKIYYTKAGASSTSTQSGLTSASASMTGLDTGSVYQIYVSTTVDGIEMRSIMYTVTAEASALSSYPICFLADAPVLTPAGYRPISSIKEGALVRTAAGRDVVVKRVFAREYHAGTGANPVVIPKGAFGALHALPISPNHEVMVAGRGMVKAKELGLRRMKMTDSFTYYNLELEDWVRDNLVVAGVECESLAPAERIMMTKAEFSRFVWARYGHAAAARLRLQSVCFEEAGGIVSMPKL